MERQPRDAKKDRLVTNALMAWSYAQVGLLQCLAGLFAYTYQFNEDGINAHFLWFNNLPQTKFAPITDSGKADYAFMCCAGTSSCQFYSANETCPFANPDVVSRVDLCCCDPSSSLYVQRFFSSQKENSFLITGGLFISQGGIFIISKKHLD